MGKLFVRSLLVGLILSPGPVFASCQKVSKAELFSRHSHFLKGIVRDLKKEPFADEIGGENVSFRIEVLQVLSGTLQAQSLLVRYVWRDSKEPHRKYEDGKTYIFAVTKIEGANAKISTSTCVPEFSEDELKLFSQKTKRSPTRKQGHK